MNIIKRWHRLGVILACFAVAMAAFAGAAQAATAMIPVPPGGDLNAGGVSDPSPIVRTVVVGGMPGWQIALIAIAAALVAAGAAVFLERARFARLRLTTMPA
jgi:hypothetical protein